MWEYSFPEQAELPPLNFYLALLLGLGARATGWSPIHLDTRYLGRETPLSFVKPNVIVLVYYGQYAFIS